MLAVGTLDVLQLYFGSCRALSTYRTPYQVPSDYSDVAIGVCTRPNHAWRTLWPHLIHYD